VQPSISGGYHLAALVQPGTAETTAAEASAPTEHSTLPSNVIPIRRGASSEDQDAGAGPLETDSSNLGYSAIVFRPAFYGNLRC
jgi:hypothetical protein